VLLFLAGCNDKPRYEFLTMSNGVGIWRCDHKTGEVDVAIAGGQWKRVGYDYAAEIADAMAKDAALSNYAFQHTSIK
jgi:hypothetical protein